MERKLNAAFVKLGGFSHINQNVLNILHTYFPDFQIEVIDVFDLIRKHDSVIYFHCLKIYWKNLTRGKDALLKMMLYTPYAFKKVREEFLKKVNLSNYHFTFSTGSMYDFSIPGVPHFIYTDHTHLANLENKAFDRRYLASPGWIEKERTVYQNASLIFTMSSNITNSLIKHYNIVKDKIVCVHSGANITNLDDHVADINRYKKRNILFVGIEWERKGGPVLIEACRNIIKLYPDLTLTIVGCSPELNLSFCKIVGRIPLAEVSHYFKNASIFCLPTLVEPFGIVFLEAMAYKLPIIATNIEAIPDFVHNGKNGYLVEPNNPVLLSEKIIELINSPSDCLAFGQYGFELYQKQYTWKETGTKISQNIRNLLSAKR